MVSQGWSLLEGFESLRDFAVFVGPYLKNRT